MPTFCGRSFAKETKTKEGSKTCKRETRALLDNSKCKTQSVPILFAKKKHMRLARLDSVFFYFTSSSLLGHHQHLVRSSSIGKWWGATFSLKLENATSGQFPQHTCFRGRKPCVQGSTICLIFSHFDFKRPNPKAETSFLSSTILKIDGQDNCFK